MLDRINFRDFGGIRTTQGRMIRNGLLYRSGVLQKLNRAEQEFVESLRIQSVIDLRSIEEQEKEPSSLPGKLKISLPCNIDRITRERLRPLMLRRKADARIREVIMSVYSDMVDLMVQPMGELIKLILTDGSLPLVIHCRAGKDRTGFAVALIQSYLGMDQESVIREYLKSNAFMMPRISKLMNRVHLFTAGLFPKGNLQAAAEVRREYLIAAMNRVNKDFGGVESYLMTSGITENQLKKLKSLLLEP